jgi:predicted RNA-binding protein with PIN domain
MPAKRIWIMDGHNIIFAIQPLQKLQVSDHREEARAGLADRLERFAIARGDQVLVVFDGNEQASTPGARQKSLLETTYTPRGEGAADERIIREATRCLERGMVVTVVTNDVNTLARRLPRGVRHLKVREFWLKHIEQEAGEGGGQADGSGRPDDGRRAGESKRVEGDFSEVEREMMARSAVLETAFEVRESLGSAARAGGRAGAPSAPGARARAAAEVERREQTRVKRERGRLRQERRLRRRAKP